MQSYPWFFQGNPESSAGLDIVGLFLGYADVSLPGEGLNSSPHLNRTEVISPSLC